MSNNKKIPFRCPLVNLKWDFMVFYLKFYALLPLMASTYFVISSLTLGNKKNKPIIFGNTNARIIASENLITASNVAAAPITTNNKNNIL